MSSFMNRNPSAVACDAIMMCRIGFVSYVTLAKSRDVLAQAGLGFEMDGAWTVIYHVGHPQIESRWLLDPCTGNERVIACTGVGGGLQRLDDVGRQRIREAECVSAPDLHVGFGDRDFGAIAEDLDYIVGDQNRYAPDREYRRARAAYPAVPRIRLRSPAFIG